MFQCLKYEMAVPVVCGVQQHDQDGTPHTYRFHLKMARVTTLTLETNMTVNKHDRQQAGRIGHS